MRRSDKLLFSLAILFIAYVVAYPAHVSNYWLTPWDFGFIVHSYHGSSGSVSAYISEMHEKSIFYVSFVAVIQEITNQQSRWLAVPGGVMLIPAFYAYLRSSTRLFRVGGVLVAIGGPLMAHHLIFSLRRDALNLVLVMTFILFAARIYPRTRKPPLSIVAGVLSLILWLSHYTIWPFFALVAVFYPLIAGRLGAIGQSFDEIRQSLLSVVSIVGSVYLYPVSVGVFVGGAMFVGEGGFSGWSLLSGQRISIDAAKVIESPATSTSYAWYPELWIVAAIVAVLVLSGIFAIIIVRESGRLGDIQSQPPEVAMFLAASFTFGIWAGLLVIRGYFSRVFYLWPIMIIVLLGAGATVRDWEIPTSSPANAAVVGCLLLLVLVSGISLIPAAEIDATPDEATRDGAVFAGQNAQETVYTGLDRANIITIFTSFRDTRIPTTEVLGNGSIALDRVGASIYAPSRLESGCVLTGTESGTQLVSWGGTMPAPPSEELNRSSRIYANGDEVLVCGR